MKKLGLLLLVICIVTLTFAGCGSLSGDSDYLIAVWGTDGLQVSGSYMVMTSDGRSTSRSVDCVLPCEYKVTGTIVSAVFQKKSTEGRLVVGIHDGNGFVATADTSAAYGVVSVATP